MIRFACLASVIAATGCLSSEPGERAGSGQCPAGEECSETTPNGLHFGGARLADTWLDAPAATAVGGTQEITIQEDTGNELAALNAPYIADDDGGAGVRVVEQLGATVRVEGAGNRSNYLRIVEQSTGLLFDRYKLTGAAIEDVALTHDGAEMIPPGAPLVWGPGLQRVGVALLGEVQHGNSPELERLVDTSMEIALGGATTRSWDLVEFSASVGTHPVVVTAGNRAPRTLDLVVVSGADELAPVPGILGELTVRPGEASTLCLVAANNDRYVYGLTWRFEIDGELTTHGFNSGLRNCISYTGGALGTTVPIVASAGGLSKTFVVQVVASAKTAPIRDLAIATTAQRATISQAAAGERALANQ